MRRMVDPDQRERLDEALVVWTGPFDALADREHTLAMFRQQEIGTVIFDSIKDVAGDVQDGKIGAEFNRTMQLLVSAGMESPPSITTAKARRATGSRSGSTISMAAQWIAAGAGVGGLPLGRGRRSGGRTAPPQTARQRRRPAERRPRSPDRHLDGGRADRGRRGARCDPPGVHRSARRGGTARTQAADREGPQEGDQRKTRTSSATSLRDLAADPGSGITSAGNDGYVKGGPELRGPPRPPQPRRGGRPPPPTGALGPPGAGGRSTPSALPADGMAEPTNPPNGGPPPMATTDQFAQIVAQLDPLPAGRRESIARMATEEVATCPRCGQSVRRCDPRLVVNDQLVHLVCGEGE